MSIAPLLIGLISIVAPGFFLALALLRKTKMNMAEIIIIGIFFGLIFPPALTWGESYFIKYIHFFSFSEMLYNINVIILTAIGVLLSIQQGALSIGWMHFMGPKGENHGQDISYERGSDHRENISRLRAKASELRVDLQIAKIHEKGEADLKERHAQEIGMLKSKGAGPEELIRVEEQHKREEKKLYEEHENEERKHLSGHYKGHRTEQPKTKEPHISVYWIILILLMFLTFASRIVNLGVAPTFFEFDPYFDLMSTRYILTYGYQPQLEHSAWPSLVNGTNHELEPIVPYFEAYWYELSTSNKTTIDQNLLATVSSIYPPIVAALLVFAIFMYLYHEYGGFPAIMGAAFTTLMPTLISSYIAGEELLEPWGITTLFFFFAAYLLAVKNPKERRYAILAGIAFASTFLGAHYYTVDAGILAAFIIIEGVILVLKNGNTLKNNDLTEFYKMNAIVIAVIVLFYVPYYPYGSTLQNRIPNILGMPVIVGFPILALFLAMLYNYAPILAEKYNLLKGKTTVQSYLIWAGALIVALILLLVFSPLGNPVKAYISLSARFTTPSIPLFMTVQEFAPTGFTYDFGSGGFGAIGASLFNVPIIIYAVLIIFVMAAVYEIIFKTSKSMILSIAIVMVLAAAGFSEVKYLPHFGIAYIIAIGVIVGELYYYMKEKKIGKIPMYVLYIILALGVLLESFTLINTFLAYGQSCASLSSSKNPNIIGLSLFCNQVPDQWLAASAWMRANIGPYAPRILSWWDYGDWINWFGNSNAVTRGDNSVATFDYAVAAHYVLGANSSYGPSELASFMNKQAQAKYVLFDDQLIPKWGALDFLACVHINQTSRDFAKSEGQKYGVAYVLGTSQCELMNDPVNINIPTSPQISSYCAFSNTSITAVQSFLTYGDTVPQLVNQSYCVGTTQDRRGLLHVYTMNGSATNMVINTNFYNGRRQYAQNGPTYYSFMVIYLPNGPNSTVTNAPTHFYNSSFYRSFFFGKIKGFKLVYPLNFSGINFVNASYTIMILQSNNYTGAGPTLIQKPSWVHNNFTVPG